MAGRGVEFEYRARVGACKGQVCNRKEMYARHARRR